MSINATNTSEVDRAVAAFYGHHETQTDDVALLRRLLHGRGRLRILEPFCGTGRILVPLGCDGHEFVGLDQSAAMLGRCREKVAQLPAEVQQRITLAEADVTAEPWPAGFDVALLAANCFYELATAAEQEGCIASAAAALKPGGWVYVDNNHMEGELAESWQQPGVSRAFPTGVLPDGTRLEGASEVVWFDAAARLCRSCRTVTITRPDGTTDGKEWLQQKHPPSMAEVRGWLEAHGLAIERLYGDRRPSPYTDASPRAIFWARTRAHG